MFGRDLGGARQCRQALGHGPVTRDLSFVEVDDLLRVTRDDSESRQERFGLVGRRAGQAFLSEPERFETRRSSLETDLCLPDELFGALETRDVAGHELVCGSERIEVARLGRKVLEATRELRVGSLATSNLARDANGIRLATYVGEAFERTPQVRRALGPGLLLEPPLHELRGDDTSPAEAISELDVGSANARVALPGYLVEGSESLV